MPELTSDTVEKQIEEIQKLLLEAERIMIKQIPDGSKKINLRRQCLTHMFALSIMTAQGVLDLVKDENLFSSGMLARAILEQFINMQYIYITSSYENLVRYLYDGDASFIKNASELRKVYDKINQNGDFDTLIDDTSGGIAYRMKSVNDLKKYGHVLKRMPPSIDRVRLIDAKNHSMDMITEYYYSYTHLSSNVHTTKDKIIEMTYAQTYSEWMQATSQDSLPYRTCTMLNMTANVMEEIVRFYLSKNRLSHTEAFKKILQRKMHIVSLGNFDLPLPLH